MVNRIIFRLIVVLISFFDRPVLFSLMKLKIVS